MYCSNARLLEAIIDEVTKQLDCKKIMINNGIGGFRGIYTSNQSPYSNHRSGHSRIIKRFVIVFFNKCDDYKNHTLQRY